MSVIMTMRVSGDPAKFEEAVAADAEAIDRIMDVAKLNGLIAIAGTARRASSWPSTSGPTRRASILHAASATGHRAGHGSGWRDGAAERDVRRSLDTGDAVGWGAERATGPMPRGRR